MIGHSPEVGGGNIPVTSEVVGANPRPKLITCEHDIQAYHDQILEAEGTYLFPEANSSEKHMVEAVLALIEQYDNYISAICFTLENCEGQYSGQDNESDKYKERLFSKLAEELSVYRLAREKVASQSTTQAARRYYETLGFAGSVVAQLLPEDQR